MPGKIRFDTTGMTPEQIKQEQAKRRKLNSQVYYQFQRELQGLPPAKPRADRSKMTPDQIKEHINKMNRDRRKAAKNEDMPTNKKEYYHSRPPEVKEKILARMRENRIRLHKEKREAAGLPYIPKADRSKARAEKKAIPKKPRAPKAAKLPTPLPRAAKPKHKLDPIKIGKQERVLPTRKVDESKLVKLYIPERRMHVLYDPSKRTEQEVREKYKVAPIKIR
jgi:hypothetical protein